MAKYNYDKKVLKGLTPFPFLGEVKTRNAMIEASPTTPPKSIYNANVLAKRLHPAVQHCRIAKVVDHGDAKSFTLVPDAEKGTKELAYFRASQYVSVALNIDGAPVHKPYTIRSGPKDALGTETVYSHRLPTRRWAMKFRPDGNGVAFGKAAEYGGALELPGDWDIRLGSESWLSRIYPVGSLYLSTAATDPAALFGGSWERIEDVFLLASGSGWGPGSRGGEASHTLSIAELPAHGHDGLYWGVDYKQTPYPWGLNNDGVGNGFSSAYNGSSRGGPNASHAMYTGPSGGGEAHNNMPPYLAVFVWKRTA